MNFQQLAQALHREAGIAGAASDLMAATATTGEKLRLFQWIDWAARDVFLAREDWSFRRGTATVASTVLSAIPASAFGITNFAAWKPGNADYQPSAYRVTDGAQTESALAWVPYDKFRMRYMLGVQTPGAAQAWSISPADELLLAPAPDTAHFVRADYIKDYTSLVNDSDTPIIPARFHMIIVWRALLEYGGFEAASDAYQRAQQNYNSMWGQLTQSQLGAPMFAAQSLA